MKHINVALFVVHKGCPHTCSFCNQRSISGSSKDITASDVHEAAKTAIASLSQSEAAGGEIAFFGGSFTMVERSYMISLLEAAYEYVEKGIFKGIRISTRPDGISEEICENLKKYGMHEGNRDKIAYTDEQIDALLRLYFDMECNNFGGLNQYTFATDLSISMITRLEEHGIDCSGKRARRINLED